MLRAIAQMPARLSLVRPVIAKALRGYTGIANNVVTAEHLRAGHTLTTRIPSNDNEAEAQLVRTLQERLQTGPTNIGSLRGFRGEPSHDEAPEAVADWEAFMSRYPQTFRYDPVTKRVGLRDLSYTRSTPAAETESKAADATNNIETADAEARVVTQLMSKLKKGPIPVSIVKSFLGNPNNAGGPEALRLVADLPKFVERHPNIFCYDDATKRISLLAGDPALTATPEAEARVVLRVKEALQGGPVKVCDLRSLLGDSSSGGGLEDLRVIANIKAFVSRHTDTFAYDAVTKRLSLSGDKGIDPAAEARVVHRLKAKLSSGPIKIATIKKFLANPKGGGGPEDVRVVADCASFVGRHSELLAYDAATTTLTLCSPTSGTQAEVKAEARVIKRSTAMLRAGPAKLRTLKGFLGDRQNGGGPEDLRVVENWETFLSRHTERFVYDPSTQTLSLRKVSDAIDPEAEARVVERLTAKLLGGPMKVDYLRAFLGEPFQGGRPEDLRVVESWAAFIGRHAETFVYNAKTPKLSLVGSQRIAKVPQMESRIVQYVTVEPQHSPKLNNPNILV